MTQTQEQTEARPPTPPSRPSTRHVGDGGLPRRGHRGDRRRSARRSSPPPGSRAGERVVDVAAGSGNAAIPAALPRRRRRRDRPHPRPPRDRAPAGRGRGRSLRWRGGDAEAMPYDDGEYDVAMSCVGRDVRPAPPGGRRRLVRVLRPGGRIGLLSWTPAGFIGQMFATMKPYAPPPPPGAQPPPLWGDEAHVRGCSATGSPTWWPRRATLRCRAVRRRGGVPRLLQAHLRADDRRLPLAGRRPGAHGRARRRPRRAGRRCARRRRDGVGVPAAHGRGPAPLVCEAEPPSLGTP